MTQYKVAINWHAGRETEKVETLCTFLESNGFSVHRWTAAKKLKQVPVHVRVIVVCRGYVGHAKFEEELARARESKTPLVFVWFGSQEPNRNTVRNDLFDELIYNNDDQNTFYGMVLGKIVNIVLQIEPEDGRVESGLLKRNKLLVLITFTAFISLVIIGVLFGIGKKVREEGSNGSLSTTMWSNWTYTSSTTTSTTTTTTTSQSTRFIQRPILVLRTHRDSLVINEKSIAINEWFDYGEDTEARGSCGITWHNKHFIFGGRDHKK